MTDADKPAFSTAVSRLVLAMREPPFDTVRLQVYFDSLRSLPLAAIETAADEWSRTGGPKFPTTPQWYQAAYNQELARRRDLRPGRSLNATCQDCSDTGWQPTTDVHGVKRVQPCPCRSWNTVWQQHQVAEGEPIISTPTEARAVRSQLEQGVTQWRQIGEG